MSELISVIIPVYNAADTIDRCAKSLFAQTYPNYELIFVDDGSKDGSGEKLDQLGKDRKRMKVIHQENAGAAKARNVGMNAAQGDYICFVDSDDIVGPNYLKKMHGVIEVGEADVACVQYVRNKEIGFEEITDGITVYDGAMAIENLLRMEIKNGPVAKLFKRSIIGKVRMPDSPVAEDLAFNYKVFKRAERIAVNNSILYSYMAKNDSLSKKFSIERMKSLEIVKDIDTDERTFYSKARLFMEAYFICEQMIMAKAIKRHKKEYREVCKILSKSRRVILKSDLATKRQKLIARLLGGGPKFAVLVTTAKQRLYKGE